MHLPVLARLRDRGALRLVAICDLIAGRAAQAKRKFGFLDAGGEASAFLARKDIDAVFLFANAQMHYEYGIAALRAGKHLFVEKPVAPSFAQAQEMADMARRHGLVAACGHNRRFFPSLLAARALAGQAGWRGAEAVFHKNELGQPPPFGARSWLGANGIHALDALVFMMGGLPEQVAAHADDGRSFSALMRWPDGASAVFLCNNSAGARREEYVFHAPAMSCRVEEKRLVVESGGKISQKKFASGHDGILAEHEAFLDVVRGAEPAVHDIAAVAPSLFLAERIEEGYSGRLALPASAPVRLKPASRGKTILVVDGGEMLRPVGRLIPEFSLASLDDIRSARGDIVAALLGRHAAPLGAAMLDCLPNLGVVGFAGLSLVHLEAEALVARGISLMHASQAYADSVAEFALGLAILGRRRAFLSHAIMRQGGWGSDPGTHGLAGAMRRQARSLRPRLAALGVERLALGAWRKAKPLLAVSPEAASQPRDLMGSTAGLIGWGANARAFARRLAAAGVKVRAWSEHGEVGREATRVSLGEALSCDIVSLHRGLTKASWHFLGAAELARLSPGTVLINIARGALIEPDALLARLRQGDIFACLDTFEEEPLPAGHALRQLPNVFLTSHMAGGAPDMHAAAAEEIVSKVAAFLRGTAGMETISAAQLATMS